MPRCCPRATGCSSGPPCRSSSSGRAAARRPAGTRSPRATRAVRQQRRGADRRCAEDEHARARQRLRPAGPDPLARQRLLAALLAGPSRSMCASTIAPTAATISSAEVSSNANRYLVNSSSAIALTLPPSAFGVGQPGRGVSRERPADARREQQREADPEQRAGHALAAQRLHQRVRGVPADQHQHEQEQDHDRAGVDDDLHQRRGTAPAGSGRTRPRHIMVATSDSAEWMALRSSTMPIAPASATGPRIQNSDGLAGGDLDRGQRGRSPRVTSSSRRSRCSGPRRCSSRARPGPSARRHRALRAAGVASAAVRRPGRYVT